MRKPSISTQILLVLKDLQTAHPSYPLCNHISTALSEYKDIWGIDDKDFLSSLLKYKSELELNTIPDKDIDKIIEEGKNLETLFNREGEEDWDSY